MSSARGPELTHRQPDDRRVEHRLTLADPAQGVDENRDVRDAVLEQVTARFGMVLEEAHGVARLEVMGQDEDGHGWVIAPDRPRGDEPFFCMRRWHLDVDDREVRSCEIDLALELVGRSDRLQLAALDDGDAVAQALGAYLAFDAVDFGSNP